MLIGRFCVPLEPTLVFLGRIVVVDLLSDAFAFAQISRQIFLLLLIVVAKEFFPVVRIYVLLLLNDLSLYLLLNNSTLGHMRKYL